MGLVTDHIKQQITTRVTLAEARRFEALAREHYGLAPTQLLRRLALRELAETADVSTSAPMPQTTIVHPCR